MSPGEKMKMARGKKGLSQVKCAERIGATKQQWQQWESGYRSPNYGTLEKIAEALDMSLVELLSIGEELEAEKVA